MLDHFQHQLLSSCHNSLGLDVVASLVEHRLWEQGPQWLWRGSRAQARGLWCTGLAALRRVRSSPTRDQTCVSCITLRQTQRSPEGPHPTPPWSHG